MMRILIILFFLILASDTACTQDVLSHRKHGISAATPLFFRGGPNDRDGIGMSLALGYLNYLGSKERVRLNGQMELGIYSWPDYESGEIQKYTFTSLQCLVHFDLIRIDYFAIPISFGPVVDISFEEGQNSIQSSAIKIGTGLRISKIGKPFAFEFMNVSIIAGTAEPDNEASLASVNFELFKMEYKF